jgi:hypothetical protein
MVTYLFLYQDCYLLICLFLNDKFSTTFCGLLHNDYTYLLNIRGVQIFGANEKTVLQL